jgi:peptide/nickel transport system permease protein
VLRFAGLRLLAVIPTVLVVTFVVSLLVELAPGDAADAIAGANPDPALVASIRHDLHLDQPFLVRYVQWLGHAVTGDLGTSYFAKTPVSSLVLERMPVTLALGGVSLVMLLVLGFGLGVLGAMRPGGVVDRVVSGVSALLLAVPAFWLALVLVLLFAVRTPLFPAIGYTPLADGFGQWLRHLILPAVALAVNPAATIALQLKSALVSEEGRDYLLAARARGLRHPSLLFKHALKNASVPVVTILGFRVAVLIGGTVIIETVFAIPGMGLLAQQTAVNQDVPVILGVVTVTVVVIMLLNGLVDIANGLLNPKLRITA